MLLAIFVSCVLGFLAGLGVGGGSLLVLWLTAGMGMDPQSARCINLLFFLPAAFLSRFFRRGQGLHPLKKRIPAILAGCITAGVFSFVGMGLDTSVLKKLFGGLLILTGARELCIKKDAGRKS